MKRKNNKKINFSRALVISIFILFISVLGLYYSLKNLKYGLDLQGGFEVLYEVNSVDDKKVTSDMINSTYKIISKRIDALGVSEPEISIEGNNIRVTMAGIDNIEDARKTISTTASLTFRTVDGKLLMTSNVLNSGKASVGYSADKGYYISLSVKDTETFYNKTKEVSEMENNYIVIWLDYEDGQTLTYGVNNDGVQGYGYYTSDPEDETKKVFHVCGDIKNSNCLSYAGVSQGFASDVIIQGKFTNDEAKGLVDLINSGSMPTKLKEISSRTVTASFGENSLEKTYIAGVVGIVAICILLIALYNISGVIASVSVTAYTFLTILIFNLVGGRLSLQGIAALVIGIGMAVDSAVITYSRIKEELNRKVSLSTAFALGSKESFISILDANMTTLIAAIILFIFGESSVKGFATMLIISIITTFIVMVYLNKYIIGLFVKSEKFEEHKKLFIGYREHSKTNEFDFVKHKNIRYIIIGLILLFGIMFTYSEGLNLGIDFKGGSTIEINSKNSLNLDDINSDIEELEYSLNSSELINSSNAYVTISNVLDNSETKKVEEYFNQKYDATTSVGAISNQVKKDITRNALKALIYACIGMILYITIRFKFSYSVSAIIALIHDCLIILTIFSLFKLEINSMFIAAILSIIGYSINNTIVIFDRIRENKSKMYKNKIKNANELKEVVNVSLRQTLFRCIISTITTMLPVLSLIILGSHQIFNFNIALLVGLIAGTFSSMMLAGQIWMCIESRNIGKDPNKHWYDDNKKEKEELKVKGINC